jgi:SAM-dependent methyltransferase
MCNACFLAVLPPTVTIQLVVTSLALLYGQRLLFPKSTSYKWARRITLVFTALVSLILFALGTFLLVLFLNEDLRSRGFANLCVSQNLRASPLDEHRCGILHKGNTMGRVLEIGPGPGTNFKCFQENNNSSIVISSSGIESYVAVEPNPYFEEEMRKEHAKRGLSFPLDIAVIKGEEIDVPSESFDVVVLTHVLCSVNSVDTVLSNAERAVKPGGRIIFMEHVIAPDGTTTRFVQRIVEPMLTILGNCHFRNLRREFEERYSGSGLFDLTMLENFEAPMPKPMAFVRPHIKGVITKKGN